MAKRGFTTKGTKDAKKVFTREARGIQTFVLLVSFVVRPFLVSGDAMSNGYVFA